MRYDLYNDREKVAVFCYENGLVTEYQPLKPALLPKQIVSANAEGFTQWARERAIDLNTYQHREMAHMLLGSRDRLAVTIMTHMFSISDTFFCFPYGQYVSRDEICNPDDQNAVSELILVSSDTSLRLRGIATPNASTDGSFPKTWRYEKGEWWLYKLQSLAATRSEHDISHALRDAGFDAAYYAFDGRSRTRIKSRNFVEPNTFFEPYDSFRYAFADKSDSDDVMYQNLASLGAQFEAAYRRILLADALFMNTDRHTRNFGVIRSSETGDALSIAPNFDNNQAYLANGGSRYSNAMLLDYKNRFGFTRTDKDDLAALVSACSKYTYLKMAQETGAAFLNVM